MDVVIRPTGEVRMIYDERLDIHSLGQPSIRRGSHVEPNADGFWTADLSPMDGPVVGPFASRSEAIEYEIDWLNRYWL